MQEFLFPILIGLSISIIAGLVFYIFKIRQLYLVQINFFDYGSIQNKDERILEFKVINRSRFTEEKIIVSLPIESSYELLGSDYANIIIEKNQVKISRLPKLTEITILVLAKEHSRSSGIHPEITSKMTKGTTLKKMAAVPLNYGDIFVAIVMAITVFLGTIYSTIYYLDYANGVKIQQEQEANKKILSRFAHLKDIGWQDNQIISYAKSELSKLYSDYELPISIKKISVNGKNTLVTFFINNKTIFDFDVTISLPTADKEDVKIKNINFASTKVCSNTSLEATSEFEVIKGTPKKVIYTVFVKFDNEIFKMEYVAKIDK